MLHVWLRAQNSPLAVWHADTKQWQSIDGWQQLHDVYCSYKTNSHKTLCLYFPSSHLLQVSSELSAPQLKQLGTTGKQYLFEETSLAPVEQLEVRQIGFANSHYLYALAQSDIETWQQSATLVGLTIQALLPDFLLLPVPEEGAGQQVVLYQDDHTAILRQSAHQGLAVSYLPLIFERLPKLSDVCVLASIDPAVQSPVPSTMSVSAADGIDINRVDSNEVESNEISSSEVESSEINSTDTNSNSKVGHSEPENNSKLAAETATLIAQSNLLLTTLASKPAVIENPERHALNFFIKSSDSQLSPYLRVIMMVVLSALVLQIATDGVQWYRYSEAAAATKVEVAAQYQSWFPNEALSTRTKLQAQVQPKLRSDSQAPASHMAILARVSPLIKQSSLRARSLVMEPTALSFILIAPDRSSLDQFASALTSQGLNANLERVNSNDQGQFSGQVTVSVVEDSPVQAAES